MFNNREMRENLFGKTEKIKATNDNIANKVLLRQPFHNENSVIYFFCVGCGTYREISKDDANKINDKINLKEQSQYIESGNCEDCDSDNYYIALKNID